MINKLIYNDKIAKYIKIKFNEIDLKINGQSDKKPKVIVMFNGIEFPEIGSIVDYINGTNKIIEKYDYSDSNQVIQTQKFNNKLIEIRDTYTTQEIALMVNIYTSDIIEARNILGDDRPNIHLMSGGSTYTGNEYNYLRAVHTDDLAVTALYLFASLFRFKKIRICTTIPNEQYTIGLITMIENESYNQNVRVIYSQELIGLTINEDELCFAIMSGSEMETFIKNNTINGIIIGADIAYNFSYDFRSDYPNLKAYVLLQSGEDITTTTIALYEYLYNIYGYDRQVFYLSSFIYDLLYRTSIVNNFNDITNVLNGDQPPASLVSITYSSITDSPPYGGYWFVQAYPDDDIINTRMTRGSVPTLKKSAFAEVAIQHAVWAGEFQ